MKTIITDNNCAFFPQPYVNKECSTRDLMRLRNKCTERINSYIKRVWKEHPGHTHLVYYAEIDGIAHIYVNGFIMTDDEFEKNVASRSDVGFVGAYHRGLSI